MWCPSCGAEYRPGFARCPDCDVDLVDELPAQPEREPERGRKLGFDAERVIVRPADLDRAREVIDAAGVGELDLEVQDKWEPADAGIGERETASDGEPAASDWDDDLSEPGAGPWYSRPWGQVVMSLIALLVVIAMIATYALQ